MDGAELSDGAEVMSAWGALGADFHFLQRLALRALEVARQLPELRFDGEGLKLLGVIFFVRLSGALEAKFFDESRRLLVASAASLDIEPLAPRASTPLVLDWADRVVLRKLSGWEVYGGSQSATARRCGERTLWAAEALCRCLAPPRISVS